MKSTKATATVKDTNTQAATGVVSTISDAVVTECIDALNQVAARLGDNTPLNGVAIRHSTKMRKGGAEIIPQILALCQQHGVTQIGKLTTTEMSTTLDRGNALLQVGNHVNVVKKKVSNLGMQTHGRSWQIATTLYKTLQRMAVDDPDLALGLKPVQAFFQTKKTKGTKRETARASKTKTLAKQLGVPIPTEMSGGTGNGGGDAGAGKALAPADTNGANGSAQAAPPAPEAPAGTGTPVTPAPAAH
jgi:hypothetical protein